LGDPEGSRASGPRTRRPRTEASAIVLEISGPIARADIPGLCRRVRRQLEGRGADVLICDVATLVDPDAVTVDALARLQLTARRSGCRVRLYRAGVYLEELLSLMGLDDVVPAWSALPGLPRGQAEEGEPARRIEEEADPGDPTP
jgi:ABC-type transporter Mla MlaB component